LRYISALLLFFYGVSKLTGHQLNLPSEIAHRQIGSLDGYTLTWFYYGYSHTYKYILGLIQVTCAWLLLFRKTALLAALMIVPMMINILLINIFYTIAPGAEGTATFIIVSMLLLIWHQREPLIRVLWTTQTPESNTTKLHWIIRGLICLFVLGQIIVGSQMPH
jgi:hypothetical protein